MTAIKPLIKNFLFMISIIPERTASSSTAPVCPSPMGTGHPNIIKPMLKYMRTSRSIADRMSLRRSFGVSVSFSSSSADASPSPDDTLAPYPAFSTALIISSGEALPSTFIEFVRRETSHFETPSTPDTAFSTCAWHAAQLIPVILYPVLSDIGSTLLTI